MDVVILVKFGKGVGNLRYIEIIVSVKDKNHLVQHLAKSSATNNKSLLLYSILTAMVPRGL